MPPLATLALPPDEKLEREDGPTVSYADRCLGDEGVRALCAGLVTHARLTSLDLRGCHIHGPGVAAVCELVLRGACKLSSLSLEWNGIGTDDAGGFTVHSTAPDGPFGRSLMLPPSAPDRPLGRVFP